MGNGILKLVALALVSCAWQSRASAAPAPKSCTAKYEGDLVLAVDANGRTMTLQKPYDYVDGRCEKWLVPAKATVDGASIPQFLWSIIGGPFEGPYRNASVIHDWYCAVRTMPWQQVHKMFYEAMITSGVPPKLAKLMYFGVYYGGPRWDSLTIRNSRLLGSAVGSGGEQNSTAPMNSPSRERAVADAAAATIGRDDPSIEELASLADGLRDGKLTAQTFLSPDASSTVGFALASDPDRIISKTPMQTVAAGSFKGLSNASPASASASEHWDERDSAAESHAMSTDSTAVAADVSVKDATDYKESVQMGDGAH